MNKRFRNLVCMMTAASVLALATLACGAFKTPGSKIETGPTQVVDVQVPMPEDPSAGVELNLEFIAGDWKITPGSNDQLVSGKATFNAVGFEPKVETNGSVITLRQGDQKIDGIPSFKNDITNAWEIQLANTPMSLNIQAGAYDGDFEFGGLSLEKLAIAEGGSDLTCAFSEPNNVEMSAFTFATGASSVEMKGLANANFAQMNFSSGAGSYTLSFDGNLQRDASVMIDSGVGTVTLIVPEGVNAQVNYEGGLSSVNVEGSWAQNGDVYTLSGSGHALTITVKMGAGTLNLKTE